MRIEPTSNLELSYAFTAVSRGFRSAVALVSSSVRRVCPLLRLLRTAPLSWAFTPRIRVVNTHNKLIMNFWCAGSDPRDVFGNGASPEAGGRAGVRGNAA